MGNTWKIVLATVVIFGAGVGTGGLLVNYADRAKIQRVIRQQAARTNWQLGPREVLQRGERELRPMMEKQRMDFTLRASRELQLTPEQQEHVEQIVREGQERTRVFWEKAAPELHKHLQDVREQIRAELTPEQRKKFEQLLRQQARAADAKPGPTPSATPTPGRGSPDARRPGATREGLRPARSSQPSSPEMPTQRPGEGNGPSTSPAPPPDAVPKPPPAGAAPEPPPRTP
jgi:hypothetical protein